MKATPSADPIGLDKFVAELQQEADALLSWWAKFMKDESFGGFYGSVDNSNVPIPLAPKGIVLNSRILWTFSAAYNHPKTTDNDRNPETAEGRSGTAASCAEGPNRAARRPEWLSLAHRAYEYIVQHFVDREYVGVYWSLDSSGLPLDNKKQIYGQAFCIYGLAEYFKASGNPQALALARDLFHCIETYSRDPKYGGYLEARDRKWGLLSDLRLSEKDANEAKSMNTHLHIIEAYSCLYTVWKDAGLEQAIQRLLDLFREKIIDPVTRRQTLFFDERWTPKSTAVSFGHDIEAAWLLNECAEIAGTPDQVKWARENAIGMAEAAVAGLDSDGGLWYELEPHSGHWIKEKHWWPQAEAMAGFFKAWLISGNKDFLHYAFRTWDFIKNHLQDTTHGEWYWGIQEDNAVMSNQDKAGFWKCPYHNVRACLEITGS